MTEEQHAIFDALEKRAEIYRELQSRSRIDADPSYSRYDCFQQKAEAIELAIYEAKVAAGLPATAPDW